MALWLVMAAMLFTPVKESAPAPRWVSVQEPEIARQGKGVVGRRRRGEAVRMPRQEVVEKALIAAGQRPVVGDGACAQLARRAAAADLQRCGAVDGG